MYWLRQTFALRFQVTFKQYKRESNLRSHLIKYLLSTDASENESFTKWPHKENTLIFPCCKKSSLSTVIFQTNFMNGCVAHSEIQKKFSPYSCFGFSERHTKKNISSAVIPKHHNWLQEEAAFFLIKKKTLFFYLKKCMESRIEHCWHYSFQL